MKSRKTVILLSLGVLFFLFIFFVVGPYYHFITKTLNISPLTTVFPGNTLKKVDNQVGILILGIPGGTHDGPNLSDSITVANYNFDTNTLTTIGVPRDIWSSTLQDKINSAYAFGEAKQEGGGGIKLAKAEVSAIVGIPIQYAVVINFNKFKELIDYLGGIDVTVQHSFVDHEFPIEGKENDECGGDPDFKCRYETVSFEQGKTHMNGETALKFVRSRHAVGDQGTDFARSQRQQVVLSSLKEKIIGLIKGHDIDKLSQLYKEGNALLVRDITNQQLAIIGKNIVLKKHFAQKNISLSEDIFEVPDYSLYEGRYVLIPTNNDYDALHSYITCLINKAEKECHSPNQP